MNLFQLDFDWQRSRSVSHEIEVDGRNIEIIYQRNEQARRYRLYLDRHGKPRVTIPRRGSRREAESFFQKHKAWLSDRLRRFATQPTRPERWNDGSQLFFRGELTTLALTEEMGHWTLRLGSEKIPTPLSQKDLSTDLRKMVEAHLKSIARTELPARVLALAAQHSSPVRRITIRNQATRWGSCSRRGTISLNWRLVQTPIAVRDYIILHELMHFREMNHSPRFWACVAEVCPEFQKSELWLRKYSRLIL